jgi:hypothetical protein
VYIRLESGQVARMLAPGVIAILRKMVAEHYCTELDDIIEKASTALRTARQR